MPDALFSWPAESNPAKVPCSPGPARLRPRWWAAWLAELSRPRSETEIRARLAGQLQG